ncbi:hypothetical protein DIPPA_33899 [Diplonema papillatum]|nr:hypothetical protein DIPPA_33899 [Diplonema papillatum]
MALTPVSSSQLTNYSSGQWKNGSWGGDESEAGGGGGGVGGKQLPMPPHRLAVDTDSQFDKVRRENMATGPQRHLATSQKNACSPDGEVMPLVGPKVHPDRASQRRGAGSRKHYARVGIASNRPPPIAVGTPQPRRSKEKSDARWAGELNIFKNEKLAEAELQARQLQSPTNDTSDKPPPSPQNPGAAAVLSPGRSAQQPALVPVFLWEPTAGKNAREVHKGKANPVLVEVASSVGGASRAGQADADGGTWFLKKAPLGRAKGDEASAAGSRFSSSTPQCRVRSARPRKVDVAALDKALSPKAARGCGLNPQLNVGAAALGDSDDDDGGEGTIFVPSSAVRAPSGAASKAGETSTLASFLSTSTAKRRTVHRAMRHVADVRAACQPRAEEAVPHYPVNNVSTEERLAAARCGRELAKRYTKPDHEFIMYAA